MARIAIPQLVAQLVQDGVAVARAEVNLAKTRLSARLAAARTGAIFLVAAGVIALVSLIAFAVGLVLALALLMNPALAGLVVLVGGCAIAGILAWIGAGHLSARPQPAIERIERPALEAAR